MAEKANPKLKNYKILEAFVQCDFLDGFSYIDKAGEIVNGLVREKKEIPRFNMGLHGLTITDISETIPEVRISSNTIWLHFVEPKNLGDIAKDSGEFMARIIKTLKPTIYKRIGWRTYLARDESSGKGGLKISKEISSYELQNIALSRKLGNFDLRVEISPLVQLADESKKSLLFDVDISKQIKTFDPKTNLDDIRRELRSEELLSALEELVNG